jgi:hypothetical protein
MFASSRRLLNVSTQSFTRSFAILARPTFPSHYDNFIDGKFVAPVDGKYFDNVSPIGLSLSPPFPPSPY